MSKTYQKALVLCPSKYSLFKSFKETLSIFSHEVSAFDLRETINAKWFDINTQMFRFPNKIRSRWDQVFLTKINNELLNSINEIKPDLIFIYNSEYLLPNTCKKMAEKAKLIFFMGDSPFYTPVNNYYLTLLQYADLILSPDSFWIEQLNALGIDKTAFYLNPLPITEYNLANTLEKEKSSFPNTDILYVGTSYVNTWGYKKAHLMNQFINNDFRLYGNRTWQRWFKFFPELEKKFQLSGYITTEKLNIMFNKTKIVPVDGNPAIINGIHARAFEALASGCLPLIEFRKDVTDIIFKGVIKELPLIRNYQKAAELAEYYLKNESIRLDTIAFMRNHIGAKYNHANNADLIIENLKN